MVFGYFFGFWYLDFGFGSASFDGALEMAVGGYI
jgi:hypothetical protein